MGLVLRRGAGYAVLWSRVEREWMLDMLYTIELDIPEQKPHTKSRYYSDNTELRPSF